MDFLKIPTRLTIAALVVHLVCVVDELFGYWLPVKINQRSLMGNDAAVTYLILLPLNPPFQGFHIDHYFQVKSQNHYLKGR